MVYIHAKKEFKITSIGSCLCEMIIDNLVAQSKEQVDNAIKWEIGHQSSQQRSDIVVDFINRIMPDTDIIQYYLSKGKWPGHNADYAKWFTNYTLQQITTSSLIIDDTPDILLLDSLCDVRHCLYQHQQKRFKALLGNIDFDDQQIKINFERDFKFQGLLSAEQTKENIEKIISFYSCRTKKLHVFYAHFPFAEKYLDNKWLDRAYRLKEATRNIKNNRGVYFSEIDLPMSQIKPITDPSHPNYSPQVWNHFYPEVYQYFA